MEKEELVSIIIPVYQAELYLKETIQSIKNQTYSNWEAIFIDDVSQDNSKEILEKNQNEKMTILSLKEHSGPALARNEGIKLAKGRYLCFLDADDYWKKEKIEKQVSFMKENRYNFSYTGYEVLKKEIRKTIQVQPMLTYQEALKNTRILTITAMIDLKYISKEEIYMKELPIEDMPIWWKLIKSGHLAYGLNEPLACYRKVKYSRSSNLLLMAKNRWTLYRKEEELSFFKTLYYYTFYLKNAILKRW